MNSIFSILYAIASVGFIIAVLPQLIHIIRAKTVEGFSLQTYDIWVVLQLASMPYIYQTGDVMWFAANAVWLVYYFTMVLLIQHYRYPHYMRVIVDKVVRVLRLVPVPIRTRG
jgi:hypothetical protein